MKTENYGDSELARRYGVTRYPAVFVDDILVAKPKDFGFYGKGEGAGDGRYTPWKDPKSHEKFREDLTRMIQVVLAGDKNSLQTQNAQNAVSAEITSLPEFQVTDLGGKSQNSAALSGRPVIIEFWATWCPPCRSTLGWLGGLKKEYGDRLDVVAVAVESDEDEVRKVTNGLGSPLIWAMGNPDLARSFGDISAVPTLYLFDQKGKVVKIFYGATDDLHSYIETYLKSQTTEK
jgi:thiol-disulfide isomerase/thioredoxin